MNNKMIRQGLATIAIVAMAICGVLISVGSDNTLAAFGAKIDNPNNFASVPEDPCAVPDDLPEPFFHYSLAQQNAPNDGDPVPDLTSNNNNGQFLGTVFSQSVPGPCGQPNGQFYFPGPMQPVSSPWQGNEIRSGPSDMYDPDLFTVATWFRYDNTSWEDLGATAAPDNPSGVLAQFGAGTSSFSDLRTRTIRVKNDGTIEYWGRGDGPTMWWGTHYLSTTSGNYLDGNWHHVAVTMSSSGTRLYVNGALVDSNGMTNGYAHWGRWFFADGRSLYSTSSVWDQLEGNMKHIAYWKQELSAAQVATLASKLP